MRRVSAVLVASLLGLLIGTAVAARADQADPRLDGLFRELRTVTGYLKARNIEREIWSIWTTSSHPEINRLMSAGIDAMAMRDYRNALKEFTRIVEAAPDFAEGWNKRATVLWLIGDYEGSLADVDRTLALEPRHFGALAGLGHIHAALDEDEAAIAAYEKALAINPHMPGVIDSIEQLKRRLRDKEI
jgi:tetratricopeptide (TPR) repeat protein